jgi:hypothetical protein
MDPFGSEWRAARLLGGTLAAFCKKEGEAPADVPPMEHFETYLRCPDCRGGLERDAADTLRCAACGYQAANEGGVFNLLRSADRAELYPGDREDAIDFSLPGHGKRLLDGWYELEGIFGNKYRWIGARATARLSRVRPGPQRLRLRGHAHEAAFASWQAVRVELLVNGRRVAQEAIERPGLFVIEADLEDEPEYRLEILASPTWQAPGDDRTFTVNVSMIRLVPRE